MKKTKIVRICSIVLSLMAAFVVLPANAEGGPVDQTLTFSVGPVSAADTAIYLRSLAFGTFRHADSVYFH